MPLDVPVVSVEAGVTLGWNAYFGGGVSATVGIDRFGASAPGDSVMRELGMTVEAVVEAVRSVLG
jgi:transketolase